MNEKTLRIIKAKSCFGHIGGTLGDRLFKRLLELGWFEKDEDKATVYSLTELGKQALQELGVDIYDRRR
jgi:hypothetical protein